jgi:hypothetical protein
MNQRRPLLGAVRTISRRTQLCYLSVADEGHGKRPASIDDPPACDEVTE